MVMRCSTGKHGDVVGGVHFVLVSDFYQLPPVLDKPLYSHLERGLSLTEANGRELYRSCSSFVELTEQIEAGWNLRF